MEPKAAEAELARATKARKRVYDEERTAIVEAVRSGVRQKRVVEITGYSREQIRRIAREAGIPSARPRP